MLLSLLFSLNSLTGSYLSRKGMDAQTATHVKFTLGFWDHYLKYVNRLIKNKNIRVAVFFSKNILSHLYL
jgi:hypothetical protein